MNYGLDRLPTLPVSVRLIREIHEKLLTGMRGQHLTPGELRTNQNWIGPGGCTLAEAGFVPPPPHEVPRLLGELAYFLHVTTAARELRGWRCLYATVVSPVTNAFGSRSRRYGKPG